MYDSCCSVIVQLDRRNICDSLLHNSNLLLCFNQQSNMYLFHFVYRIFLLMQRKWHLNFMKATLIPPEVSTVISKTRTSTGTEICSNSLMCLNVFEVFNCWVCLVKTKLDSVNWYKIKRILLLLSFLAIPSFCFKFSYIFDLASYLLFGTTFVYLFFQL